VTDGPVWRRRHREADQDRQSNAQVLSFDGWTTDTSALRNRWEQSADQARHRFSPLTFSTLRRPPRPRSTSSRYADDDKTLAAEVIPIYTTNNNLTMLCQTLVPAPRSFFMDVKCPGCFTITTVFSHAQTVVICQGCTTVLCQPTGGKARLTEGCSFRRK